MVQSHFNKLSSLALCAGLITMFAGTANSPALATDLPASTFGCKHLEELAEPKSIEGEDGFFFRIYADLRLQHTFTEQTVQNMSLLAHLLKEKGTTLVYAPVPTKSQAMPLHVPERAGLYGYDQKIASFIYDDVVERLRNAGVVTVDLQQALRKAEKGEEPFFRADFHWNSDGARLAAQAIGEMIKSLPEYGEVEPSRFETARKEKTISFSGMRKSLQRFCKSSLPSVESYSYETTKLESGDQGNILDLFGNEASDPIALIGTSFSDSVANNFDGFIRQYSSLGLTNYAITGGNQFGAMLSYLTSSEFQENRPRFLIWENPIYNNLGQYGPAPWVELWAAAANECGPDFAKVDGSKVIEFTADMQKVAYDPDQAVLIDANDESVRAVAIHTTDEFGNNRTIALKRGDRLRSTGRFVVPLRPLGANRIDQLRLVFDRPSDGNPTVKLCSIKKSGV